MKRILFTMTVIVLLLTGCSTNDELFKTESETDGIYTVRFFGSSPNSIDADLSSKYYRQGYITTTQADTYGTIDSTENSFFNTQQQNTSTFSIDVDTASYSLFRRYVSNNVLPPVELIRTEEMVNYFDYNYLQPTTDVPFNIQTEYAPCPWNSDNNLLMIGIQGKDITYQETPANNLVFVIDISGSMASSDKLPLIKDSLKLLVEQMREKDTISIVTYRGSAEIKLQPTNGLQKEEITQLIDSLQSGGGTNGSGGIELAYDLAFQTFNFEGNNRVILATDGDFNIGTTSSSDLINIVNDKAEIGIYLTILSYGGSIHSASMLEAVSNAGQGNYYYIDTINEADKVLNHDIASTIVAIADDVKIQIEFNENVVEKYRLIGYDNRILNNEDFENDEVDAGELGAGHNVTAFYEIKVKDNISTNESIVSTVALRYKDVNEDDSKLIKGVIKVKDFTLTPSSSFQFASAVAEVSLMLHDSVYIKESTYQQIVNRIEENLGEDPYGLRNEFLDLVNQLQDIY